MTKPKSKPATKARASAKVQQKGIKHHAKHIWHVTPKFVHGALAGAFVGIIVVASVGSTQPASALSVSTDRDCDDYAVIHCGSLSTDELKKDYKIKGVDDIFRHFGISESEVNAMGTTAVVGTVHDDGRVTVKGTTVATNAVTAARKNINGSAKVTLGGTTFYVRPVKVSFARKSSPAFVVMKNGQFDFAVLASCGNPITATPVPPKPTPPTPPVPPVTPPQPPTPPTPPVPPAPPATTVSEVLPAAGPGALILIAILAIAGGYISHMGHRHVKRKRQHATKHGKPGGHSGRGGNGGHKPRHA